MTNINAPMWGIHAGKTGDANTLFMQQNRIAIGWPSMGNLSELPNEAVAYKQKLLQTHPFSKPGAIPVNAGQLRHIVYTMQIGDLVVYPSKQDKQIHIGEITSEYTYDASNGDYPNQRMVTWLKHVPRAVFLPAALFEVGSAMSLFRVRNYADQFRAVLLGKSISNSPSTNGAVSAEEAAEPDTAPFIADNIEDITRDFILSQLSLHLKGHPFAVFVAHLFEVMGYRTDVSTPGPDGGIDIVAYKDEFALVPPIIKIQVKSTSGSVGAPEVAYLNGVIGDNFGILVTLGVFNNNAKSSAASMSKIRLLDGASVAGLVLQHYEALDAKYKSIVPLKRVYAPDDTDYQSN